ncbi:hypothetical protein F2Q69_00014042 [Brassica cretica]|uniref:Uncharacterized protein n=1 Tax=Brassica cretica TaxID=69181 RepID=A0A8S9QUQ2_BRACR|nr:hypothetical protein F2Q69_00014042 [Brassica cretica]
MDGDITTVRFSPSFHRRYRFELVFQCRRFEVNQHHVADVMPVLLKSGHSASREEAVEDEGLSIDCAPLVSIEGDARIWAEHIIC